MTYEKPYAGLKIVDLSQGLAGPYAAMLFAHYGAEVIKVEPPAGDWARHLGKPYGDLTPISIVANLGKRSIAADLKAPEGKEIVERLCAGADVFFQSNRPGVIDRLGLGYGDLCKANPRLLYVSVSGVGPAGPMAARPIVDSVMQAFSGFMSANRGSDGTPQKVDLYLSDLTTALYTFQAVSAALFARQGETRGRHIECDLLQSTSALQGVNLVRAVLEGDIPYAAATPSGTYRTVDGYLNVTVLQEAEFPVFCDVMGLDDFKEDPRFATASLRHDNREPLQAVLRELFAREGCAAWSAKLTAAGILHERVNTYREMLEHPQVAASETVDWLDEPSTGRVPIPRIPGSPRSDPTAPPPPAPHIGQHGEQILAELGYAPDQIAGLLARKVVVKPAPAREIP